MSLRLTHVLDESIEVEHAGVTLFRYVYQPHTNPFETPKPYFHPLRTLAGNLVTNFRPHDHLWHVGLAMTFAHVDGQNFWGGNNYVHGQGYVRQPHLVGRQEHRAWDEVTCDGERVALRQQLTWRSYEGEAWLDEQRDIRLDELDQAEGYWSLAFGTTLRNLRPQALTIGSPTTLGRPNAGYGSLMWRGPRSFLKGQILAAGDMEGPDVMGQRAPWLAFIGRHDGVDGAPAAASPAVTQSTLVFIDQPTNLRYPTKWFVRNDPFAAVSFASTFDEEIVLQPDEAITLHYRILLADGAWTRAQIERHA